MGWFSSTGAEKVTLAAPEASKDGGYIAPDRTARAACWEGRDLFFQCLDKHDIIDSAKAEGDKKARESCAKELAEFEKNCASSWVTYFKKRRVMEYQRDQTVKKLNAEGVQGGQTLGR